MTSATVNNWLTSVLVSWYSFQAARATRRGELWTAVRYKTKELQLVGKLALIRQETDERDACKLADR